MHSVKFSSFQCAQFETLLSQFCTETFTSKTSRLAVTTSYNRFVELQRKSSNTFGYFPKNYVSWGILQESHLLIQLPYVFTISRERNNIKPSRVFQKKNNITLAGSMVLSSIFIINDRGKILDFMLTEGNVDDRHPLKNNDFHNFFLGKTFYGWSKFGNQAKKEYKKCVNEYSRQNNVEKKNTNIDPA